MADNVAALKFDHRNAFDPLEFVHRIDQATIHVAGQVDLGRVTRHDHLAVVAEAGEEHEHLRGGGVLRLVEDDHAVIESSPTHKGQGITSITSFTMNRFTCSKSIMSCR